MNIVSTTKEWLAIRASLQGKTLGFVPTMGNLHEGHLSLCERAVKENDIAVVSIYVNPTQFNQHEDFEKYPRTVEEDLKLLSDMNVAHVFIPEADALYPDDYHVQVMETTLSKSLEGEFRPGHFTGMLTVVLKLLNLMQANKAYFGKKDYQQLILIQKLVSALFLPVEIVACETRRATDGLALSSRNRRLNAEQLAAANDFPRLLRSPLSTQAITDELTRLGFKVDYIKEAWGRRLGAIWLDQVRLIDNFALAEVES